MKKTIVLIIFGLLFGGITGYYWQFTNHVVLPYQSAPLSEEKTAHEIIGFLPYSLLQFAKEDYSPYITTLAYFSLDIDKDGSIIKLSSDTEESPGWNKLHGGDAQPFLNTAKKKNMKLSLVVTCMDNDIIDTLLQYPEKNAKTLSQEILPIMDQYGFSDLNIDVERTGDTTNENRNNFAIFLQTLKKNLVEKKKTLSVDISGADVLFDTTLINMKAIEPFADKIIIMGYDFHSTSSFVIGPVAPLSGAGKDAEYDTTVAVEKALRVIPKQKLILGSPLYGYEWQTLNDSARAALIPGSGYAVSNRRAEKLQDTCASCSAVWDETAREMHLAYFDTSTHAYDQLYYPNAEAMQAKIQLTKTYQLDGIALWALGYEGQTILNPLKDYKN